MNYYIGIDLGTSALKGILTDSKGNILRECSEEYFVNFPNAGWSEQNPEDWIIAFKKVLNQLKFDYENDIKGISFGGQMHGLVVLDDKGKVIRPCILWNDGRTEKQVDYLNNIIGKDKLMDLTGNIAFAGFTLPKLLWLKENEPCNFSKISKILLPKDYLAYFLTGVYATDYSDASGTLLLDVEHKCWSDEMCKLLKINKSWLPKIYESCDVIGKAKAEFGMPNAIVTIGAGDNAAAAIGTSTIENGECNISLGTSGTLFVASDTYNKCKNGSLHNFAHSTGKYHLMGCILSAASANKWFIEDILKDAYDLPEKVEHLHGNNNVFFLPYLSGERCPHNDVNVRGAFLGLSASTTREEMSLSVLEGVAFAFKDCMNLVGENGIKIEKTTICGGGAKSNLWLRIIANVLDVDIYKTKTEQGPSFGAAIMAMVGANEYKNLSEACNAIVKKELIVKKDSKLVNLYKLKYEKYRKIYPLIKEIY